MPKRNEFYFNQIDKRIARFMGNWGTRALRYSLAIIFIWFGLLKPLGISPAAALVKDTIYWMPVFSAETWVDIVGWWEVLIGVTFLFRKTVRLAILLLAFQMIGTFMPLILLPEIAFQPGRIPFGLTLEGQYIVKNLLIISAALVIGGTVRKRTGIIKNYP